MYLKVIKRNGNLVDFDKQRIIKAIVKAFNQLNKDIDEAINCATKIANEIEQKCVDQTTVEEIQDLVERKLMATSYKDVAKAYINYRQLHKMARDRYQDLMQAVAEKLQAKDVKNQNANVDEHSFGGRIGEASSVVTKRYALDYIVSPMAKANHENNEIYIHDLDSYSVGSHNCLSVPFDDLLANGFNTRQTDVRPAQSVNTAFQLVAVIFQLQSLQQFGGVSATHIDWTMVPYVRKSFIKHWKDGCKYVLGIDVNKYEGTYNEEMSIEDVFFKSFDRAYKYALDMTTKETYQAVEGMYHNLNCIRAA